MNWPPPAASAAVASRSARFDPNRCTIAAGDTPASFATSASVIRAGPSRAIARNAAIRMSWSLACRGRGLIGLIINGHS